MRNHQSQKMVREISNQYRNLDERTQGPSLLPQHSNEYSNVLQNVYNAEIHSGNTDRDDKLLIIAVHAVFLESGFVCLNSPVEKNVAGLQLPLGWESKSTVSVQYTLPHLLGGVDDKELETVGLKFQTMGRYVYVHGSLTKNNPIGFFRVDAYRFTPSINSICTSSSHSSSAINKVDGAPKSFHESEVFELWKIVKDGLALHMLTDLCLESGLEPPPCFTSLLPDIKLKILEFLHGTDLARVGCVSSELKSLSSNNDLWKRIYKEEFSQPESGDLPKNHWKHEYIIARENLKENRWFWPDYGNVQSFQDVVQWNRAPACILYAPSV